MYFVDSLHLPHQIVQGVFIVFLAAMLFMMQKFWVFNYEDFYRTNLEGYIYKKISKNILEIIFVGFSCLLLIYVVTPVWQIHDDSYYAMIAGGYGMALTPTEMMPYMDPVIGYLIQGLGFS